MNKVIEAGAILLVGALLLPPVKEILDVLSEDMVAGLPGIHPFEETIIELYPIALLVAVIFAAVIVLKNGRRKRERENR